ncbi:MAG: bifunctional riboflavin kinase/FAD synthetase [Synergistetes bacterium]|nr:bifunctional riboflavin kinase/FAD synthetase [Synergistota bacterium]MCX8128185.1 bifunctional riboflavin kinase/FAD synthetase [Synergistota bacterium]MDW8192561.1 bifunctional riboflavin kinase/FAD synthetase [Synergistota bacterium]
MRSLAIGAFDGVHLGHIEVIERALSWGRESDLKVSVLTFSPHPERFFKGEDFKLLTTDEEKKELLLQLGVDEIIELPFDVRLASMAPEEFFEDVLVTNLNAKFISVGFNFTFGRGGRGTAGLLKRLAEERKIVVEVIPPKVVMGRIVSSTIIRDLIRSGRVEEGAILLGRNYFFTGTVVEGDALGRKIGFPTANLLMPSEKLIPADGVYAVFSEVRGKRYLSAMNIGTRPTVSGVSMEKRVEVHIMDFNGDIYGERIKVEILCRVRGERKFQGLEELKAQIERDINWIKSHYRGKVW